MARTAKKPRPWRKVQEPSRPFPRTHQATVHRVTGRRNLTAAAVPINLTDHKQLQKMRVLREGWQNEAFQYRHSVPEIRFSFDFLASAAKRMRIMPCGYQADGETDTPVPLKEIKDIPLQVAQSANSALSSLGNGRLALAGMMHKLSTNVSVAGECWLIGQENPNGGEDWKIRSVSEIIVKDDRYSLREVPQDSQGAITWTDLDPDQTVLTRMWVPNPQWDLLADSPMRTLGETCEALQILRRGIRASGRSRLTGAGMLVMPEEIQIMRPIDDNDDDLADDVVGELMDAMATAIADEGVASADIPIFLQGPGEFLEKIRLISFASGYDKEALDALNYLQGLVAVGVNLPKSVVTGAAEELNHWSAWSVSADTFRHYIEPHVITCCDLLTAGYFRQALIADGVPLEWVDRLLLWYDPVELISAPDKSTAAQALHTAFAISDEAFRRESGFSDEDAPTLSELERRRVQDIRALPLNLLMEYARRADPSLLVPPITVAGTVPGIKAGGVDVGVVPASPAGAGPEAPPQIGPGAPPAAPAPVAGHEGPPPEPTSSPNAPAGITAAGPRRPTDRELRLSRKLTAIDKDLRARLRVAANLAMRQQLERAGKRVKDAAHGRGSTVTGRNEQAIQALAGGTPDWCATAKVGQALAEQMGLSGHVLAKSEWATLKAQWNAWTGQAQTAAIATASQLAPATPEQQDQAQQQMNTGRDLGWAVLANGMSELAGKLMFNPDPQADTLADVNLDTLVPTGLLRTALGAAGNVADGILSTDALSVGQIGTGTTIGNLLTISGAEIHSFTWDHGSPQDEFEPHADLDGIEFDSFASDVLTNPGDWPPVQSFAPGDHPGCSCDAQANWMTSDENPNPDAEDEG